MKKYRKKPIIVEAEQWDGKFDEIVNIYRPHDDRMCEYCNKYIIAVHGWIEHLNRFHLVCPDDWIIKENFGYYPLRPDIFKETYDLITDEEKDNYGKTD